jgi:class 3 adenylate cyclase/streptogramin lyase
VQRRTGTRGLGAVLFTDIVGSTVIAAEMGNSRWAELLTRHHQIVRRELRRFGGRENDTAGDGFFATFERPVDAIRCAVAAAGAVRSLGIEIRAGVSFGGLELVDGKAGGLIVNTAARVMSVAGPGEVLVPASVKDIVSGAGISFADHGVHRLKGLDDEPRLFLVTALDREAVTLPLEAEEAAERRREIFPGPSRRRGRVIVAGIAAAAVAAAAIALIAGGGDEPGDRAGARSQTFVAELDPKDGRDRQRIDIVRPGRSAAAAETIRSIVASQAAVWVLAPGFEASTLLHVDPKHGDVRDPIAIRPTSAFVSMVSAFDALWYLADDRLVRVSASTDEQREMLRIPPRVALGNSIVAADRDQLWIGRTDGILMRFRPSGEVTERKVTTSIDLIAAGEGGVWVVDQVTGIVVHVDPATLEKVGELPVMGTIDRIAVDGDYVWLLDQSAGVVTRLSSSSVEEAGQASVGPGATDLAVGLGAVWISHLDGTISRVDRLTRAVTPAFARVDGAASAITVDLARSSIWVDVGPLADDGAVG